MPSDLFIRIVLGLLACCFEGFYFNSQGSAQTQESLQALQHPDSARTRPDLWPEANETPLKPQEIYLPSRPPPVSATALLPAAAPGQESTEHEILCLCISWGLPVLTCRSSARALGCSQSSKVRRHRHVGLSSFQELHGLAQAQATPCICIRIQVPGDGYEKTGRVPPS